MTDSVCFSFLLLNWQCVNASQTASRLYCKVDQNLTLLFCIHNPIHFAKISNTSGPVTTDFQSSFSVIYSLCFFFLKMAS